MSEQWEYCELALRKLIPSKRGVRCDLYVRYFGRGVEVLSKTTGDGAREWESNPWEMAVARLGEAHWELVMVQHANLGGDMGGGGELASGNVIAYFKRAIREGRRIDEPAISFK